MLMKAGGKRDWIFIGAVIVLVTALHFLVLARHSPLVVLEELYYVPLLLGALRFGLKGALVVYVLVSVLHIPFFFGEWTASPIGVADRVLHFVFSGIFAFTAGFLVDRERRKREQAERERYLAGVGMAATTIVHDLRNQLHLILGYGLRIQKGKGDIDASVQVIVDSARSMERIVHDVLDFARPVRLELKEEDARAIVSRVRDLCAKKAEEKDVLLSLDLPAEPTLVMVDGEQIQRALVSLVNNAIEASDAGHNVVVTVARRKTHLVITVRDHGSGMDKETLERLFTPFFTTKKGGNGLGMSIAKKIIEAHDATIRIESEQGKGTEATLVVSYEDKRKTG